MDIIVLDFESYYSVDLGFAKQTTEEYVRDPQFEVIGVAVQVNDGEPEWFTGTMAETAGFLGIEGLYDDDEDGEDDGYFFEEYYNENGYSDVDFGDDIEKDIIDGDDDGDDKEELVYDGVFEEMYNPNEYESLSDEEEAEIAKMNREQRRAAEKKRKKRKLPFKGFGSRP